MNPITGKKPFLLYKIDIIVNPIKSVFTNFTARFGAKGLRVHLTHNVCDVRISNVAGSVETVFNPRCDTLNVALTLLTERSPLMTFKDTFIA
jgi:hypothetical protein